jgi:hypothetical protein
MAEKLKEHLTRCEKVMQAAKPILAVHKFPTDSRTLTVIGFISVIIEHQEAIVMLVHRDMPGSASALFRPVVEGAYRALWINLPATDAEVEKFVTKDEIDVTFGGIATALDTAYGMVDFFQNFKTRAWKHLNSYTHGGMHQIGRRFLNGEVANNYREEELYELTTSVTTIVLLTIAIFLKKYGHAESGGQIDALMETYGSRVGGLAG